MILRILGFFSSSFSRKIHHPWRPLSLPQYHRLSECFGDLEGTLPLENSPDNFWADLHPAVNRSGQEICPGTLPKKKRVKKKTGDLAMLNLQAELVIRDHGEAMLTLKRLKRFYMKDFAFQS